MHRKRREISEQSGQCLSCACENDANHHARELLGAAGALTSTGVVAAIFIAESDAHEQLTLKARQAISEQRDSCERDGPFRPERCVMKVRPVD